MTLLLEAAGEGFDTILVGILQREGRKLNILSLRKNELEFISQDLS